MNERVFTTWINPAPEQVEAVPTAFDNLDEERLEFYAMSTEWDFCWEIYSFHRDVMESYNNLGEEE